MQVHHQHSPQRGRPISSMVQTIHGRHLWSQPSAPPPRGRSAAQSLTHTSFQRHSHTTAVQRWQAPLQYSHGNLPCGRAPTALDQPPPAFLPSLPRSLQRPDTGAQLLAGCCCLVEPHTSSQAPGCSVGQQIRCQQKLISGSIHGARVAAPGGAAMGRACTWGCATLGAQCFISDNPPTLAPPASLAVWSTVNQLPSPGQPYLPFHGLSPAAAGARC
jgi:hypothetical protein